MQAYQILRHGGVPEVCAHFSSVYLRTSFPALNMQACNSVCTYIQGAPLELHTSKHPLQENIITMVQDDLASNFMNPHPGKLYNKPGGPNVYKDVKLVSKAAFSAHCRSSDGICAAI